MMLVQAQLQAAEKKVEAGSATGRDEVMAARKELLELKMRLEALRNGTTQELLQEKIKLVEAQIAEAEKKVQIGLIGPNSSEVIAAKKELLELQMRLEAARKDALYAPAGRQQDPVRVPENDQQKKLIKRIEPVYPESARNLLVRGPVILEVVATKMEMSSM